MSNNFLITGMFRSGTTMFARMLHSNPSIVCASDPFSPIYKSYRNSIAKTVVDEFDELSPLSDYYFDKEQNEIFQEIQKKDFNIPIASKEVKALRKRIKKHCQLFSPKIMPHLHMLNGSTYKELLDSAIEIIRKSYKKSDEKVIGYKEVWIDEFSPHFIKMSKNNKVIHVVRDPRSIVASNFSSGDIYPLLFLIRQWRKLASLAWINANNNANILLIKFEDLVLNSERTAVKVCNFLNVDYHSNMNDPNSYEDGNGQPWRQNSSYKDKIPKEKQQKFNRQALDQWKDVLNNETIGLIERLCAFEMSLLGYKGSVKHSLKQSGALLDYRDDSMHYSEWIKPYANYVNFKEIAIELNRSALIENNIRISKNSCNLLFLNKEIYHVIRGLNK